jgi:hypothetical protein
MGNIHTVGPDEALIVSGMLKLLQNSTFHVDRKKKLRAKMSVCD